MPSDAPWIEVHIDLYDKVETKQLARALGVSLVAAGGHLVSLWHHALRARPDGDLSNYTPLDLAEAGRWEGEPRVFARALKAHQWLDPDGHLHNWQHYTEHWRALRERTRDGNRIRQQRRRERLRQASLEDANEAKPRHEKVTRDRHNQSVTVTPLTGPDRTGPDHTQDTLSRVSPAHARARANGNHTDAHPPTTLAPVGARRATDTYNATQEA